MTDVSAMLVPLGRAPTWRLHTKLYKLPTTQAKHTITRYLHFNQMLSNIQGTQLRKPHWLRKRYDLEQKK